MEAGATEGLSAVRRAKPLLGTIVEIEACAESKLLTMHAIDLAFEAIVRIEKKMNFYNPASDLSRLNRSGHLNQQVVDPEIYEILELAKQMTGISGGVFDVCVGSGSSNYIRLLGDDLVYFEKPLQINLGGIAKGYAVDRAMQCLRDCGIESGIVNAGGDIATFGKLHAIHIRLPNKPSELIKLLDVSDCAVATSANYFNSSRQHQYGVQGLVNPLNGAKWQSPQSVTVVAKSCMLADALTKVVALAPEQAPRILGHFVGTQAIVLDMEAGRYRFAVI